MENQATIFYKNVEIHYWREYRPERYIPDNYTQFYKFRMFVFDQQKKVTVKTKYKYDLHKAIDFALKDGDVEKGYVESGILQVNSNIADEIECMREIQFVSKASNKFKGFEDFFK